MRVTVALWCNAPLEPTTVRLKVPLRAFLAVFTVNRAVVFPVRVKLAVTPPGSPVTLQETTPLNPKSGMYWVV